MTSAAGASGAPRAPGGGAEGVGLVLAGAVARGAFGVGAVSCLAKKDWPIRRVAATSSGALTAAVLGAGIATGDLEYATIVAEDLWMNHGAFADIEHLSLAGLLHVRGLLDTSKLAMLVREGIERVVARAGLAPGDALPSAARVTLVTASLNAIPDDVGPLATYEKPMTFAASDFIDPAMWPRIALAAAASATFPGLFSPTVVDGTPCIDGGAVNNTPISYVLDEPAVRRVVVVTSEPAPPSPSPASELGGLDLVARLADVLINERISHDLGVARRTNAALGQVEAALASTGASQAVRSAVLGALGWRRLDLVVVQPDPPLAGSSFSGFFDRDLRRAYIDAGKRAAESAAIASLGQHG